ncbi:Ltp family lipoprotein [Microbacterium sp. MEC084]|uniref:Ltp family lipoprotein n=1 Tax=Microbacterium sp. MEC084 TaxID=1963027 RepID=UPI001E39E050|nr:Ltp family lipoprotein [Microbacterium sp. MEC084]
MNSIERRPRRMWAAILAIAVAAGAAIAGQAPAMADGREVGGYGARYYLNDSWSATANHEFNYGKAEDRVYTGDWNGDGKDTLAVRRDRTYYFSNRLGGNATTVINYGKASDTVLVGDWNGDGVDTLAVRRGQTYYISNSLSGGNASVVFNYGKASDVVLVGDWNGDGRDTLAVRRGNVYYISNSLTGGSASAVINYGRSSDLVLVGDWNADGADTLAVRRGNVYYISDSLSSGSASRVQAYGRASDTTLVGDWNGDRRDTLGVRRYVAPAPPTFEQQQAIEKARDYLDFTAFSRSGLIGQLEYEGFSTADATYAVSYLENRGEVNWRDQAVKKAQQYLDFMSFSRQGLIDQLEYEGFSTADATYAADRVGF